MLRRMIGRIYRISAEPSLNVSSLLLIARILQNWAYNFIRTTVHR
jgi:hypothetical protein